MENVQSTVEETQNTEAIQNTEETQVEEIQEQVEKPTEEPVKTEELKDPTWYKKRIDRFTKDKYRDKEEIAKLQEKLKKYEGKIASPEAPIPTQFTDAYGEIDKTAYNKAMSQWMEDYSEHKSYKDEEARREQEIQQRYQERTDRLNQQMAELKTSIPDIETVVRSIKVTPELDVAILECDDSARVADYLGRNSAELEKVKKMPPHQIAEYLGRIEEKFAFIERKKSNAAEPIKPLTGGNGIITESIDDIADDDEWFRRRKEAKIRKLQKG
jgi:hypothetical protein